MGSYKPGKKIRYTCCIKEPYKLKHSICLWFSLLSSSPEENGLQPARTDSWLLTRWQENRVTIILVFVDDLLVTESKREFGIKTVKYLQHLFTVRVCDNEWKFIGISLKENENALLQHHSEMIWRVLRLFGLNNCNTASLPLPRGTNFRSSTQDSPVCKDPLPYQQLVGALLYFSNTTRPDILYAAAHLSHYMSCPTHSTLKAGKQLLRYLKDTLNYGIQYRSSSGASITG